MASSFDKLASMPRTNRQPMIVGHRGASGAAPENTMAAFQTAADLDIDGIEFDVQLSKDDHLVIIHDDDTKRTTSVDKKVTQELLADLQNLDAGSWYDDKYRGERIPSLRELFDFCRGNDLLLFIEIKDPYSSHGIETMLADLIREYDFAERSQVRSFSHPCLHVLHEYAPEIPISELWLDRVPALEDTTFPTIDCLQTLYTQDNLAEIHARGQFATAWTVNDIDRARELGAWGIDAIATDHPAKMLELFS